MHLPSVFFPSRLRAYNFCFCKNDALDRRIEHPLAYAPVVENSGFRARGLVIGV